MIDIKNFSELKVKKLARVIEITDENIVVAYKQFDLEQAKLGVLKEKAEEVAVQNKKELVGRKVKLLAEIAEIDAFLALV